MSIDWYPIPIPFANRLAIVARPRGGDWLADETRRWKQAGVDTVVSLLMPNEADELGLADEASAVEAAGMEFISFPIDDRGIPAQREPFEKLVVALSRRVASGETVAVHCRQGLGRAPLTAIAILKALGAETQVAIDAVAKARGRDVPETLEQRRWLDTMNCSETPNPELQTA